MAKFKCPIITCNVEHEGDLWNLTPMAIMHMVGSHKLNLTEEEILNIVSWQANPQTQDKPWPILYPEKREQKPPKVMKDKDAVKSWWDNVDK